MFAKGTLEKACEHCNAVNIMHYTDYPERDKGVLDCAGCGGELKKWKGTRDFHTAELKETSQEIDMADEKARERLGEIVDMLTPGLWLHVDGRVFRSAFGSDDQISPAKAFAKKRGAIFMAIESSDRDAIVGKFGRAYSK